MALVFKMELFRTVLGLSFICGGFGIRTYDMENKCDEEISMIFQSVYQLKLTLDDYHIYSRSRWVSHSNCSTDIEGWYSYPQLMFYFEDLDLDCDDGYLQFYEDSIHGNRVDGLVYDVCGDSKPEGVFTTNSMKMHVRYVPKKSNYITDVFTIIVTSYSEDSCPSYAYECSNSRCIDDDLSCNGYNSCGDGSDCRLSVAAIVGIVIGSIAGICGIVSVVVCIYCCNKRSVGRTGMVLGAPDVAYPQQTFGQSAYGVNHGNVAMVCNQSNQGAYPTMAPHYEQPSDGGNQGNTAMNSNNSQPGYYQPPVSSYMPAPSSQPPTYSEVGNSNYVSPDNQGKI